VMVRFLTKKNEVLKHKHAILIREFQSAVNGVQRGEEDEFDLDTLFKAGR
jgi:hypothetical protein